MAPFISPSVDGFDNWLFAKINLDWTNRVFDWFFPYITDFHREPLCWLLTGALIAFWIYAKRTTALKFLFAMILAVALSDGFSFRVLKQVIERPRPPNAGIVVHTRTERYAGASFPSNHAANVCAAGVILSFAFPPATWLFALIAFLMAYSRVYVGVHYPLDVIGGAIVGMACGSLVCFLLKRWLKRN